MVYTYIYINIYIIYFKADNYEIIHYFNLQVKNLNLLFVESYTIAEHSIYNIIL